MRGKDDEMFSITGVHMEQALYSIAQAAPLLGIAEITLRRCIKAKKCGHCRIGDRILIRQEDLDAFLAFCYVPSNSIGLEHGK